MFTTIFADASFCTQTRAAGYGAWIKSDTMASGKFLSGRIYKASNPAEAELAAVARAVQAAEGGGNLIIQTDCVRVIQILMRFSSAKYTKAERGLKVENNYSIKLTKQEKVILEHLNSFLSKFSRVFIRHVKGHKGAETSRNAINSHCDRLAKEVMRNVRGSL